MKDIPLSTHILEELGFEEEGTDVKNVLIYRIPNNENFYISSYFEKGQDSREYLFLSNNTFCDSISTLKDLYRCLEMQFDIGSLTKENFFKIEAKLYKL